MPGASGYTLEWLAACLLSGSMVAGLLLAAAALALPLRYLSDSILHGVTWVCTTYTPFPYIWVLVGPRVRLNFPVPLQPFTRVSVHAGANCPRASEQHGCDWDRR